MRTINDLWNYLASLHDGEMAPLTYLWRQVNYYYAHDLQMWAITNAIMLGLTVIGVLLLVVLVNGIRRRITETSALESEQQLLLVLQAVKLIDENRKHLQEVIEVLKKPAVEGREQPEASFGPEKRCLANGHVLMEHSEVTG